MFIAKCLSCCKVNKVEASINVPTFDDKKKKRKCTDIPFLALFGLWPVSYFFLLFTAKAWIFIPAYLLAIP